MLDAPMPSAILSVEEEGEMKYRVLIEQDEEGVFVAEVPSLPGCISQGETRAQALENIKEAIAGYLESLEAHNEPVPPTILEEIVEISA
jgi:predicted RNase H-like HicB family nuclease